MIAIFLITGLERVNLTINLVELSRTFNHQAVLDNHNEHKLDWYINANNKPIKNEYNMWQSKTGAYYLNFVHGSNYNKPPAKKWDFVEQYLFTKYIR